MFLGLRTVVYAAPDLAAAAEWYTNVLGFPPYFREPYYVGFSVGGFELGLVPDGVPSIEGASALWGVDDIAATYAALLEAGAESLEPVLDVGGGVWVASVRDPFGNRVGLVQNPHFDPSAVR